MHNDDRALESFQLALNAKKNAENKRSTLLIQYWISPVYERLGRFKKAKEMYEFVYAEQLKILGSGHRATRWMKEALDRFEDYDSGDYVVSNHYDYISNGPYSRKDFLLSIPYTLPADIQCRTFAPDNGFDFEISPRRNSTDF